MESDAAVHSGQPAGTETADASVTALYQAHALGLIRLAYLMLGDASAAEDVVQEAFAGLYRRWAQLSDPAKALPYLRSSVLNASRSQLRRLGQRPPGAGQPSPPAASAEAAALAGEDRRAVLNALRAAARPPARGAGAALLPGPARARDRRGHGYRAEHRAVHGAPRAHRAGPDAGGAVMSMLEDRVRRALRETAAEITPLDVPRLRPPDANGRGPLARGRRWPGRRARGWPGWLTPLAAAAAVAAVLAGTLALTGTLSGHRPGPAGPAGRAAARRPALLPGAGRHQGPAGLAAAGGDPGHCHRPDRGHGGPAPAGERVPHGGRGLRRGPLCAGRAADGGRAGAPGHPARAGEDGQAPAQRGDPSAAGPIRFYQVSIGSSGQVSAPRLLAVPALPDGTNLTGLALTPDGRKLAVASQPPRPGRDPEIQVDTLATGAQRAWTWPGGPADPGEHRRDRLGAVLGGGRQHTGLPAVGRRLLPGPAAGHHGAGQQPGGQPGGAAADMGWQR